MRRTKFAVCLSESERAELRTLIGQGRSPARRLIHARILLEADQSAGGAGWADAAIAGAVEVHPATVARVRRTSVEHGFAAALARKTPERVSARRLDGAAEARLIALACGDPPAGRGRWTLRLLADELVRLEVVETGSHETIRRTFQQTASNPG